MPYAKGEEGRVNVSLVRVRHECSDPGCTSCSVARKHALSPTEVYVIELICDGLTDKQIGDEINAGAPTVKSIAYRARNKIGVDNRVALAAWAFRSKLVEL